VADGRAALERPTWGLRQEGLPTRPQQGEETMITFVRTASIAPGKVGDAIAFAHKVAKLVEKITGLKIGVSIPVGGNPFRIAWVTTEPDLASVEANMSKLLSNAEYMSFIETSGSYFLPGSVHDEIWRSMN
jgi:hypothetical protein